MKSQNKFQSLGEPPTYDQQPRVDLSSYSRLVLVDFNSKRQARYKGIMLKEFYSGASSTHFTQCFCKRLKTCST